MLENNREKITQLIQNESIYSPLNDEKIAESLSIYRETVTGIRKELNIPNSRERKKQNIQLAIQTIKQSNPQITTGQLLDKLSEEGFQVSRNYIADLINNTVNINKKPDRPQAPLAGPKITDFSKLTGFDGSLTKNIQQAKAAMLYPPFGLPTLIIGDSGTGKSMFAECMYQYAVNQKVLAANAPFVALNCADYGDNPQLLLSILYGHKKGAFTGADQDTEGLVERAHKGILFLDEIHRLPPKGQEILFSILDKGQFRRLGEGNMTRKTQVFFIGATTENIESSFLLTFRRRIPMIIELPPLKERPVREKAQLIYDFFQEEANRTKCRILVNRKILSSFTIKEYPGNIGQLKSEIQVTCANAYVEKINSGKNEIIIDFSELLYNTLFQNIERNSAIAFQDALFVPLNTTKTQQKYPIFEDIYVKVEKKYQELKKMNISTVEIEKIIWNFILNNFDLIRAGAEARTLPLTELKYLVGDSISRMTDSFYAVIRQQYPDLSINEKVLVYLAIHLDEALKRIKQNQEIVNPNILHIKESFKNEFELALQLAEQVEKQENIRLPEGEIGFIAIYIKEMLQFTNKKNEVEIITVCHGKIASEMIAIVNHLMGVNFPIAVDMPFNENPAKTFKKVVEIAKTFEKDTGILFFVDMGSLANIGEIVHNQTGLKTRTIDRVDIVSVMEAVRKVYIADDRSEEILDDVYYDLIHPRHLCSMISIDHSYKKPVILCTCLTGRGIALKIKELLAEYYPDLKTMVLSVMDEELKQKINIINQQYNILAIIGTINPRIHNINFIPFETDFSKDKKMLVDYLVKQQKGNSLKKILDEDFIFLHSKYKNKQEVLEAIGSALFNKGYIKSEFLQSLFTREEMSSTCFKNGIAIPHGLPVFVERSAIVFVQLQQPIEWDGQKNKVVLICLPAIKSNDVDVINEMFRILKDKTRVDQLLKAADQHAFIETLCSP
ncbi:phosphotransferase system mannose-type iia component [Lucifera butyrica]|uniref:Phosphotransferase system mannose-type iia component n=1 Tax=Lucifera butyrica TaxID=1351585 RepID=A0A498R8G3_9FIRM|nr:sigma 54-interacting transcriptional regulator [Lucifera butyrica]VBB07265.1 phosphotransferase system mannose-type iia component [Lucifera butyrica]